MVTTDNSLGVAFEQYEQYRAGPTACNAPSPEALTPMAFEFTADEGLNPAAPITATVQTSCGDLVIGIGPDDCPPCRQFLRVPGQAGLLRRCGLS